MAGYAATGRLYMEHSEGQASLATANGVGAFESKISEAKCKLEAQGEEDVGTDQHMGELEPGEGGTNPEDYERGHRRWKHDANKPHWFKFRRSPKRRTSSRRICATL